MRTLLKIVAQIVVRVAEIIAQANMDEGLAAHRELVLQFLAAGTNLRPGRRLLSHRRERLVLGPVMDYERTMPRGDRRTHSEATCSLRRTDTESR